MFDTLRLSSVLQRSHPPPAYKQYEYLIGIRGLLTIQTFLWMFLSLFVPAAVKTPSLESQSPGPFYAVILRKTLGVLLWNPSLIYSSIIFLSARTICIPFLSSPSRVALASILFRRTVRLFFPCLALLGFSWLLLSQTDGYQAIDKFRTLTKNTNISTPYRLPHALAFLNSTFDLFWITKNYATQAASRAFPSGTLYVVSLVYMQSYTVFMTMVIVPYTRNSWRVKSLAGFIVAAWWVQSWAWYSVSGLLLADAIINMDLRAKALRGLPLLGNRLRAPIWLVYGIMVVAGFLMQYLWTAWRPQYQNYELEGHTGLYNASPLNGGLDLDQPQARDDNYLIILGFFLLADTYEFLQRVLSMSFFVHLGNRSFSTFSLPLNPHIHTRS